MPSTALLRLQMSPPAIRPVLGACPYRRERDLLTAAADAACQIPAARRPTAPFPSLGSHQQHAIRIIPLDRLSAQRRPRADEAGAASSTLHSAPAPV